jgi:hypothetical protein
MCTFCKLQARVIPRSSDTKLRSASRQSYCRFYTQARRVATPSLRIKRYKNQFLLAKLTFLLRSSPKAGPSLYSPPSSAAFFYIYIKKFLFPRALLQPEPWVAQAYPVHFVTGLLFLYVPPRKNSKFFRGGTYKKIFFFYHLNRLSTQARNGKTAGVLHVPSELRRIYTYKKIFFTYI